MRYTAVERSYAVPGKFNPLRRLLMTVDTVGGVWTYALELARALQDYDIDIALATMGAPLSAQQRALVQPLQHITLYESAFKLEWMADPWEDVKAAGDWLLELEARIQPDLVHLNGYVHGALPWQSPTLIVGHSCVTSWFAAVKGTAPPAGWERYYREVSNGLRAADLVTAPTRAMLAALKTHYGTFATAPAIYNGRSASDFRPRTKVPCILTVGRVWDEAKNIAALEQIASSLSWPVFVAGEDQHPAGGKAYMQAVQRLGSLTPANLAIWLSHAAIFALPARYEPFGLAALEAGLAGCALVLGDIPSLREVWGEAALFIPPDQPAGLAAALQSLMQDTRRREILAQRARTRALQFTPARMAQGYMTLYTQLVQHHQPAGR
jgi:glycogen synthase